MHIEDRARPPSLTPALAHRLGRRWRLSDPEGMAVSNQVLVEVVEWWELLPDPVAPLASFSER